MLEIIHILYYGLLKKPTILCDYTIVGVVTHTASLLSAQSSTDNVCNQVCSTKWACKEQVESRLT